MQESPNALNVLSAMITPAVLISACGTLVLSTSTRLTRIVDRVRELSRIIGTIILFYGCVMLIAETRLALRSVNSEMQFTLRLREKYQQLHLSAKAEAAKGSKSFP